MLDNDLYYDTLSFCLDTNACVLVQTGGSATWSDTGSSYEVTDSDGNVFVSGDIIAPTTNGFDSTFVGDACYFPGCTDDTALNYDPEATDDDGSCIAIVEGCTDSLYLEYDPAANVDNDSCLTFFCGDGLTAVNVDVSGSSYCYEITWNLVLDDSTYFSGSGCNNYDFCMPDGCWVYEMADSYGDGWNGGEAVISSGGLTLLTASLPTVGWTVTPEGTNGSEGLAVNADCGVLGCTDETAENYDPEANVDDGNCQYAGCTDLSADNYNPDASIEDGTCTYSCSGEYVSQIDILITTDAYEDETSFSFTNVDNGALIVPENPGTLQASTTNTYTYCVDNGTNVLFELVDEFGDGIVGGGYQIYVCESDLVYSDFGFVGEGDLNQEVSTSYEFYASCGDIAGCIDPDANNYNMSATVDNGSCEYDCGVGPNSDLSLSAVLTFNTASYGYEMSWELLDSDSVIVAQASTYTFGSNSTYTYDLCLEPNADYLMSMSDSYGDGWNGSAYELTLSTCDSVVASGTISSGYAATDIIYANCDNSTDGAVCEPWNVILTGANHTIMIPDNASVMIDDVEVTNVAVGVFYMDDSGMMQSAGYAIVDGSTVQVAAMGDDTTTPEVDGLSAGQDLVWMMFDCSTGMAMPAVATYSNGPSTYTTNGLTFVATISNVPAGPDHQMLDLPNGWSMFSTYMMPAEMDLVSVLAPIVDHVIIAKDNSGNAYLTEWNFNGVGDIQVGQGYQIKLSQEMPLMVEGEYAFPEDHSIDLSAGWNMIGYLRMEAADAVAVLSSLSDANNLIIAKDYNGNAYLPEYGFNGIGDMHPGQGYQLKTDHEDVLQYLSNDESYRLSSLPVVDNSVSYYERALFTDNNMTIVIEDAAWDVIPQKNSEIAAYDASGNLVGSALYTSPTTVLTVWGNDATSSVKDGLTMSESLSLKIWNSKEEIDFIVTNWSQGSSNYQVDAINVVSSIETGNLQSNNNSIERELVKIVNILGQEVNMEDDLRGVVLFNVYSDGTVEKVVK
jgi:hypothetical protein